MADTKTFGVKVPEELHQEAQELQKKLGLSGEGFLGELIRAYKVEKAKEEIPQVTEDLRELQGLTQRINNIYLNLGYRIENISKIKDQETQAALQSRDTVIANLQQKVQELEEDNKRLESIYNDIVNDKIEILQRVNELTESNNNIKALNEEYKSKNDTLSGIITEYKQYKDQVEEYKKLLADSQARNIELNDTIKEHETTINNLTKEISTLYTTHDNDLKELKDKHAEEVKNLKEKAEFENEKAILDLERKAQTHIQGIHEEYNNKILNYQKQVEEMNIRYNEMLKELKVKKKEGSNQEK